MTYPSIRLFVGITRAQADRLQRSLTLERTNNERVIGTAQKIQRKAMDNLAKLISALSTLAWPIVVAFILFKLLDPLRELVHSARSRRFTIKVAGNELTMEDASEQQQVILRDVQAKITEIERRIASESAVQQPQPEMQNNLLRKRVLWVDDNPKNNSFLIASLEAQEAQVEVALSTVEGLAMFKKHQYDFVISDMGRPEGEKAGIDLTQRIKAVNPNTPVFIYCGSWAARHLREEAVAAGASAITSSGTTLLSAMQLSREG